MTTPQLIVMSLYTLFRFILFKGTIIAVVYEGHKTFSIWWLFIMPYCPALWSFFPTFFLFTTYIFFNTA